MTFEYQWLTSNDTLKCPAYKGEGKKADGVVTYRVTKGYGSLNLNI